MNRPCYFGVCYVEIKPFLEHLSSPEDRCVTFKVWEVNFDDICQNKKIYHMSEWRDT